MRELPSFEQFNESIKTANINEGVFHRLPKNIITDELYLSTMNLQNFYARTAAGNDVDPGVIDTIIRGLDKVKKAVKKFNSKEEVAGTVYEAEKMVFDEIGAELEALQKKILDLMRNTTDSKWRTALGSASTALSNLDRNLSQADAKLGVIPMKESEEVNEGDMTKDYDGFIVLDSKTKKLYKFRYVKGTSNVKVENDAIDKLIKANGLTRANYMVHGFVRKGEWDKNDSEVLESVSVNEASSKLTMKETQMAGEISQVIYSYKNLKKDEKVNVLNSLITRVESGELSESESVNEASVQVAGKAKPAGAQVLATVIMKYLEDNLLIPSNANKKGITEELKQLIMDSTF
jgi:hypothetical protein